MGLFKAYLHRCPNEKALQRAIDELAAETDHKKIEKIAKGEKWADSRVRCAAIARITDEKLLEAIACNEQNDSAIREAALCAMRNEERAVEIAVNAKKGPLGGCLVNTVHSQELLLRLAEAQRSYSQIRKSAIMRIDDQTVLAELAENSRYLTVREAAFEKLTDISSIVRIAKSDSCLSKEALSRIDDEETLFDCVMVQIANHREDWYPDPAERIQNEDLLVQIAVNSHSTKLAEKVLFRMNKPESFVNVALHADKELSETAVLYRLNRPDCCDGLLTVLHQSPYEETRLEALKLLCRFNDERALSEAIKFVRDNRSGGRADVFVPVFSYLAETYRKRKNDSKLSEIKALNGTYNLIDACACTHSDTMYHFDTKDI